MSRGQASSSAAEDLPAREAQAAATSRRIITSARDLFLAKNYSEVTTGMIARAAAVTKGGLYHHFPSKESLYVTMMLAELADKERLFEKAVAMRGSCRERLARLTRDFLDLPSDQREVMRLVRRDINVFSGSERDQLVKAYQRALPEKVEAIIAHGILQGELDESDPRLLSWTFVALVEIVITDYAQRVLGDTSARLEYVLDAFFTGSTRRLTGAAW